MIKYEFIKEKHLEKTSYQAYDIKNLDEINIATTSMYIGKNHCACILAKNLTSYFSINNKALKNISYEELHTYIHNGPIIFLAGKLKRYYKTKGINLSYKHPKNIIKALNNNHPCALLLSANLYDYHWVLCVGYRKYSNQTYLKILNGWDKSLDTYYPLNSNTKLLNVTEYYLR